MSTYFTATSLAPQSQRIVLCGLVINTIFAITKIAAGILGHSHALLADGLESTLDVFASILMLTALKLAEAPPDAEHPYGHGKVEPLASIFGALLLIFSGGTLAWSSFTEIAFPSLQHSHPAPFTLVILILVILIKGIISHIAFRKNKIIGSSVLGAEGWHHGADAMTSLAAFIGISLSLMENQKFHTADDWATLFSCAIIIFNGLNILRYATKEILDARVSKEITDRILEVAQAVPGVKSAEKCRARKSGIILIADLHIRVNGNLSVREGHQISHNVIRHLLATGLQLRDITVHLEPE